MNMNLRYIIRFYLFLFNLFLLWVYCVIFRLIYVWVFVFIYKGFKNIYFLLVLVKIKRYNCIVFIKIVGVDFNKILCKLLFYYFMFI